MPDYLIFHRSGFWGVHEWLIIQNVQGKQGLDSCCFSGEHPRAVFPRRHALRSNGRSGRWLAKLEAVPLDTWETTYRSDACDGVQWSVQYRFEDESAGNLRQ